MTSFSRFAPSLAACSVIALVACRETPVAGATDAAPAPEKKVEPAVAAAPPGDGAAPAGASQPAGTFAGKESYEEEAFTLRLTGPKAAKVGEAATYSVELVAASGFKVNDEYPIKFKFEAMTGMKPAKDVVPKEAAKVEKTRATLPLEVTATEAGARQVAGKLSFSVCTEERCLIEKRDLALSIDAS